MAVIHRESEMNVITVVECELFLFYVGGISSVAEAICVKIVALFKDEKKKRLKVSRCGAEGKVVSGD